MNSVKPALLRCESLDLFAGSPPPQESPRVQQPVELDGGTGEPEYLFRIRPEAQLDLFRRTAEEIAATETRRALTELDPEAGRRYLDLLRRAPAFASFVADGDRCLELIERRDPRWNDRAFAVPWIESELWPAATRCLRQDALLLVRPALLALLENDRSGPFDAQNRQAHPSYVWHLLDEPARAVAALELDPLARSNAEALLWHAQLCERAHLNGLVTADIGELCLEYPDAAENWLSHSKSWAARWMAWCELDDTLPMYAFPAWCRLTRATEFPVPALGDQRSGAQLLRIADQLAVDIHNLPLRKALNNQCPGLLAAFLASRVSRVA